MPVQLPHFSLHICSFNVAAGQSLYLSAPIVTDDGSRPAVARVAHARDWEVLAPAITVKGERSAISAANGRRPDLSLSARLALGLEMTGRFARLHGLQCHFSPMPCPAMKRPGPGAIHIWRAVCALSATIATEPAWPFGRAMTG